MRLTGILTISLIGVATLAVAHTGVKNHAVMARMESMKGMQESMKALGAMMKGASAFDESLARDAIAAIASHAKETPALFKDQETDPKSEALPVIWDSFDDFVAKAEALEDVAVKLSQSPTAKADLQPVMAELGSACKACHSRYRE